MISSVRSNRSWSVQSQSTQAIPPSHLQALGQAPLLAHLSAKDCLALRSTCTYLRSAYDNKTFRLWLQAQHLAPHLDPSATIFTQRQQCLWRAFSPTQQQLRMDIFDACRRPLLPSWQQSVMDGDTLDLFYMPLRHLNWFWQTLCGNQCPK